MTLSSPESVPPPWLVVTALPCSAEGVVVLRVVGEVDLTTVGRLRKQLPKYLRSQYRGLVLDFTGVAFLAACGIGVLADIAEQARAEGTALRLVVHSRLVLRALEVSRAHQQIPLATTVAEAVAQCAA